MTQSGSSSSSGQLECFELNSSCGAVGLPPCWHCLTLPGGCSSTSNSDVAGLGVLLTFVITATAAILLAWVDYLFYLASSQNDVHQTVLDQSFLAKTVQRAKRKIYLPEPWGDVNQKLVMILSDQMIITGITVLIVGMLPLSQLSIYDFQTVVWLGWLASNCHQVTLTVLQKYLNDHKIVLGFRVFAMTLVWILLSVAIVLASASQATKSNSSNAYTPDSAARCAWSGHSLQSWNDDTILAFILLALNFTARFIKLSTKGSSFAKTWLRRRPGDWLRKVYNRNVQEHASRRQTVIPFLTILSYVTGRAICDICESRLFELWWLTLSYLYGMIRLFGWRPLAPSEFGENNWSFGQLLAILGLLLPLMSIPGIYSASAKELNSDASPSNETHSETSPEALKLDKKVAVREIERPLPSTNYGTSLSKHIRRREWRRKLFDDPEAIYTSRCMNWLFAFFSLTFLGPLLFILVISIIDMPEKDDLTFNYDNIRVPAVYYLGSVVYFAMGWAPFMFIWTVVAYCVGAI